MMGCYGKLSAFVVYWCIQRNVNDLMFKPNFSCYYSRIQFCCSFCVTRLDILAFLLGLNKCMRSHAQHYHIPFFKCKNLRALNWDRFKCFLKLTLQKTSGGHEGQPIGGSRRLGCAVRVDI
jgi:hypothetical protein